jgi:hypothetical protein
MDETQAHSLRQLLLNGEVASLGTLHNGEPAVSMVPFALLPDTGSFVVHVSRLATHTQDMQRHPGISIMVVGERTEDIPVQALARASISGTAAKLEPDSPNYPPAKAAYLGKFPTSEPLFEFGDFSLFLLTPRSVRFVGGFGNAWSANAAQFQQALRAPS